MGIATTNATSVVFCDFVKMVFFKTLHGKVVVFWN
jgi:hypothetical protein